MVPGRERSRENSTGGHRRWARSPAVVPQQTALSPWPYSASQTSAVCTTPSARADGGCPDGFRCNLRNRGSRPWAHIAPGCEQRHRCPEPTAAGQGWQGGHRGSVSQCKASMGGGAGAGLSSRSHIAACFPLLCNYSLGSPLRPTSHDRSALLILPPCSDLLCLHHDLCSTLAVYQSRFPCHQGEVALQPLSTPGTPNPTKHKLLHRHKPGSFLPKSEIWGHEANWKRLSEPFQQWGCSRL